MGKKYDLIVIGGGPGGYSSAIRAARYGLNVSLIEEYKVGGTCLNAGCIPTKALVSTSKFIDSIRKSADYGVVIDSARVDFKRVIDRKDEIVDKLRSGVEFLLKKNNVDFIKGHARFITNHEVEVTCSDGSRLIYGDNIIIASGTEPAKLPGVEFDGSLILNSQQMLSNKRFPKSLVIVGGGVIGCEFASIFSKMGSKITIVETMPSLLPLMDDELGRNLTK